MVAFQHGVTKDDAIMIAQSFLKRHVFDEYIEAVRSHTQKDEPKNEIEKRARYCYENTDFGSSEINIDDRDEIVVTSDELMRDCWSVSLSIYPLDADKTIDGIASPVAMKINKVTGKISDLWAEPAF